ncbi:MAG: OmpA family protein, partial [Bacteroidota bacterium]
YLAYSSNIVLPDSAGYEELTQDITLMPMQLGAESDLQNIFFEVGSAKLKPTSQTEIDYLKSLLKRYPQLRLEIIGHTDNTGGLQLNMQLSEQRAQAVVDALTESGVKPKRLSAKGMGPKQPVASNDTEAGRAQNRRVSFKVTATE